MTTLAQACAETVSWPEAVLGVAGIAAFAFVMWLMWLVYRHFL